MSKKIYGIVGHPIKHSLSPVMHNAALNAEGIDSEYKVFDIDPNNSENLANFCYETDMNNIAGFSVTMPFKEEITKYMDNYDPLAKIVGSVNTVENDNSTLNGYNTDSLGALEALRERIKVAEMKVLILGAGGAAKAISYSLKEAGANVYIFNRTKERAKNMAEDLDLDIVNFMDIEKEGFDIVINTTPVGMSPNDNESLLYSNQLKGVKCVMDIITNPIETKLIKEAKKAGCETITGERMLLHQAAMQFEIWHKKKAPIEIMEKALYEEIG